MTTPHNQCQPTTKELCGRLRAPLWVHSTAPFESPQLDKEETVADLKAAADRIEYLEATETNEIARLKSRLATAEEALRNIATEPTQRGNAAVHYGRWDEYARQLIEIARAALSAVTGEGGK